MSADEKPGSVDRIEDIARQSTGQETPPSDYDEEFTPEEQRKIIRRIDLRLVTMTGLAYCISLMDRTNLSAAAIAGYVLCILRVLRPGQDRIGLMMM
jgi:hypothetical protein